MAKELTPEITVKWWDNSCLCFYCGRVGKYVHQHGTVHVGGNADVPLNRCDDEAKCYQQRHENVRFGRDEWVFVDEPTSDAIREAVETLRKPSDDAILEVIKTMDEAPIPTKDRMVWPFKMERG